MDFEKNYVAVDMILSFQKPRQYPKYSPRESIDVVLEFVKPHLYSCGKQQQVLRGSKIADRDQSIISA
jgi:hypothetical protein